MATPFLETFCHTSNALIKSHDSTTFHFYAVDPFQSFATDRNEEPPQKKRRLVKDGEGVANLHDFIPVIRGLINFKVRIPGRGNCAHAQTTQTLHDRERRSIPVILTCPSKDASSKHAPTKIVDLVSKPAQTLGIRRKHGPDSALEIDLDHHTGAQLSRHLYAWISAYENSPRVAVQGGGAIVLASAELLCPSITHPFFTIKYEIHWRKDVPAATYKAIGETASLIFGDSLEQFQSTGTNRAPKLYYDNVHVPEKNGISAPQPGSLKTDMYGFQKRTVGWMLQREKADADNINAENVLPESFEVATDANGDQYYRSLVLQQISDVPPRPNFSLMRGGILSEEQGLGKTVELLALILLHQRNFAANVVDTSHTIGDDGKPLVLSGATLIITPPAILEQWKTEIARHAPSLKVVHYEGIKKSGTMSREELASCDVVVTTYHILSTEIHYAQKPVERFMRHKRVYKVRRSPLVQIHWWRVCLDEAQMIESGVSNAATVALAIPRINAWAVTGTPIKKSADDLLGLLIFLNYSPFTWRPIWDRLLGTCNEELAGIIKRIAIRHTKAYLRDELELPPQKRVTMTIPFTATEEQNYFDLMKQACHEIGVDESGGPLTADWNPEDPRTTEAMRRWLMRLRQTCLHAEIGGSNRRALGGRSGPLRTIDEVLLVMLNQNETAVRTQERIVLGHRLMTGHLYSFGSRPRDALEVYKAALEVSSLAVKECRDQLKAEREKQMVAKSKEQQADSETDSEDGDEKTGTITTCVQRLRTALEMQHMCLFFTGTAYFQIKDNKDLTEPDSPAFHEIEKQETACYDQAKLVRKEMLSNVTKDTLRLMTKVNGTRQDAPLAVKPFEYIPQHRGIESRKIFERITMLKDTMNQHGEHMSKWRERLVSSLLTKLLDQEDDMELTGEEYEGTTKQQDEQYVLLEAMRSAIADRHCMLTGQVNLLINHEMKAALKLATDGKREEPAEKGPAPDLFKEILTIRQALNPSENIYVPPSMQAIHPPSVSFRAVMTDIRSLITSIQWQAGDRSRTEIAILEQELQVIQRLVNSHMKDLERLERELDLLRSTMNQRLEFYRQLQQISDTVAPLQEEATPEVDLIRMQREQAKEASASEQLSVLRTKRRFLMHLQEESSNKTEHRTCIICQDVFEIGVLTVCGHQYCKNCIHLWYREHKTCPTCKRHLRFSDFHEITYKPKELRIQEEASSSTHGSSHASPSKTSIYSNVSESTLNEIKRIDLPGHSYGVKIDTISRHLLWIREHDPGAKSIVFSQYRDFLSVLGRAFGSHKIGYAEMGAKGGIERFKQDPSAECFLLHAKADSSGLNLVNATHVFLCEPLINTAIELQAIARVHRIGQRRPTQVWMYLISDTVEESIYDISVSRRLEHMQRGGSGAGSSTQSRARTPLADGATPATAIVLEEHSLDKANSLLLQAAPLSQLLTKGDGGGEVVVQDDLWACLFSKPLRNAAATGSAMSSAASAASAASEAAPGWSKIGRNGGGNGAAGRGLDSFLRAEAAESRRVAD